MEENCQILAIYLSLGHNFFGRHNKAALGHQIVSVSEVDCVAGSGLVGDRFFDYKPGYKGQVTFFAHEVYQSLCTQLQVSGFEPSVFRRNIITRGLDLNALIGQEFEIQGVRFAGVEESKPCYWMNQAFAEGAEEAMKGNGGLRARILTNGVLCRQ